MGIKISCSPYELKPKSALGPISGKISRRGALLRFDFPDFGTGYADCHPWETLGDLPLEDHLLLLKRGEFTPLTERSYYFSQLDAEARLANRSLFENLTIPKSHFLITDFLKATLPQNFDTLKIKLRSDLPQVAAKLNAETTGWNGKIRFDGNNLFTRKEIEEFLSHLSLQVIHKIDFFEDPYPFNSKEWRETAEKMGIFLAKDHNAKPGEEGYNTVILKPDVQDLEIFKTSRKRKIVTSYLGHPFGQLCAAHQAALYTTEVCGLLSHLVYEPNHYSERLQVDGGQLLPLTGPGFGFGELLKREHWISL